MREPTCMLASILPDQTQLLEYCFGYKRSQSRAEQREKKRSQERKREMERGGGGGGGGGGFHGYQRLQLPKSTSLSSSSSGGMLSEMSSNNIDINSVCTVREQDRYMPIANVIRIMRKVLPTHAKISDDAKETIQECVSEYISFITSEANERCQREQRKTITAEDVLWAMSKLGFDDYIEPLTLYLQRYREFEGERSSIRGDPFMKPVYAPLGGAAFGPAFHIGHHQGYFTTGGAPPQMNDYFRDGHGVNQAHAQAAMASYDPYAPYK